MAPAHAASARGGGEGSDAGAGGSAADILLLDNYDSYTYLLAHLIAKVCGRPPRVVRNDEFRSWDELTAALPPLLAVVVSPGPGSAEHAADFGVCAGAFSSGLPVLGVCLGHHGLALAFGGSVARAPPMHGRISEVAHTSERLFARLPSPLRAVRYHSLVVDAATLPRCLRVVASTTDDGTIMAIEHAELPLFGVQFHPESVCTEHGEAILTNFMRIARDCAGSGGARAAQTPATPPPRAAPAPTGGAPRRVMLVRALDLSTAPSPLATFARLYAAAPCAFWLDSACADVHGGKGRFSYMGAGGGPHSHVLACDCKGRVRRTSAAGPEPTRGADLVGEMRADFAEWAEFDHVGPDGDADGDARVPAECAFRCGFVGHFSYEAWRWFGPAATATELQRLTPTEADAQPGGGDAPRANGAARANGHGAAPHATDSGARPSASFLFADRHVAIDHSSGRIYLLALCTCPDGANGHGAVDTRPNGENGVAERGSWDVQRRWVQRTARALRALSAAGASDDPPRDPAHLDAPPKRRETARVSFVSDRSRARYVSDIGRIGDELAAGESYEVCLTTTLRSKVIPPPLKLYGILRELNPAPHAAYLRFDPRRLSGVGSAGQPGATLPGAATDDERDRLGDGGYALCCASPERFLRVGADGVVESRPFKGTLARDLSSAEADAAAAASLASDPKSRSENLMITDLVRNDLCRVCSPGSVEVPSLMAVHTFATVHQLVTTVRGHVAPPSDALDVVGAAFPPGSMTGAPKVRTMRIIDELERGTPRGAYSGVLGYFSLGGGADLAVTIRTVDVDGARGVSVGTGGAVIAMSEADDEWGEARIKAEPSMRAVAACVAGDPNAFDLHVDAERDDAGGVENGACDANGAHDDAHAHGGAGPRKSASDAPALLETLLHTPRGGFFLVDGHLRRLAASALALGYAGAGDVRGALETAAATWPPAEASRVRVLLRSGGDVTITRTPLPDVVAHPPLSLCARAMVAAGTAMTVHVDTSPVCSTDARLAHKTTARHVYDAARARARVGALAEIVGDRGGAREIGDVLMWNEAFEITETSIANVALEGADGTTWVTPHADCGLLGGVMRAELVRRGVLAVGVLTLAQVRAALRDGRRLAAFNSVRGAYLLEVAGGWPDPEMDDAVRVKPLCDDV